MKINDNWYIERGQDCFVVVERRPGFNRKTQEATVSETRTYHPTLEQCASKIVRSEALDACDMDTINQAVLRVQGVAEGLAVVLRERMAG